MSELQFDAADTTYEIRLGGILDASWADWLGGFTFSHRGDGTTTITGQIVDQAALHGLLKRIRDLGVPLLSVIQVGTEQEIIGVEKVEKGNQ